MPDVDAALAFHGVEKAYGALRPFRARDLRIAQGSCTSLIGLDRPAAEIFVNLATGAVLPDQGKVAALGTLTSDVVDAEHWLSFVEQFAFVSDRVALLEAMTVRQNLALPFGLDIDPMPADMNDRAAALARDVSIDARSLDRPVGDADALVRAQVRLGRALALAPRLVLLEHPTASLDAPAIAVYADTLRAVWHQMRPMTLVVVTVDDRFTEQLGGRVLVWNPATGDFRERRRWFVR